LSNLTLIIGIVLLVIAACGVCVFGTMLANAIKYMVSGNWKKRKKGCGHESPAPLFSHNSSRTKTGAGSGVGLNQSTLESCGPIPASHVTGRD
jgi:hypothetical protein